MDPTHPQPLGAPPPFRAEKPTMKPLTLPRRVSLLQRAHEASQASAETRRSIDEVWTNPFGFTVLEYSIRSDRLEN